jgi:dTDP-4-amino-4,6-dideoxygalactose transaminase
MWVRKRIEITPADIARGLLSCGWPASRESLVATIDQTLAPGKTFVCLSIRSGFDLLLETSTWPPGSEIILSGLTIPDMPRIVRRHRFQPVGVDVELDTLAPRIDSLRGLITPRTKAIVVAHLFGGRVEMESIIALAQEHGLLVIEDCAQAYVGNRDLGHPAADISMFSFGPIKTNTALGGSAWIVRRPEYLQRLHRAHERWPINGRWSFAKRLLKYSTVRLVSTRAVAGMIAGFMRWRGTSHDEMATKMARGFPGPKFFDKIRHQPSTPLLKLLARKIQTFDPAAVARRTERGRAITERLRGRVDVLGSQMIEPTYWVLPILVDNPTPLVERLWALGLDATTRSSLVPVNRVLDDSGTPVTEPLASDKLLPQSHFVIGHQVFLPFDLAMPDRVLEAMVDAILQSGATRPARTAANSGSREPAGVGNSPVAG